MPASSAEFVFVSPDNHFVRGCILASLRVCSSQFLGGDEAHTHLVKGLDFALLERARAELQSDLQQIHKNASTSSTGGGGRGGSPGVEAAAGRRSGGDGAGGAGGAGGGGGGGRKAAVDDATRDLAVSAEPVFHTTVGRSLFEFMARQAAASKKDSLFCGGRM